MKYKVLLTAHIIVEVDAEDEDDAADQVYDNPDLVIHAIEPGPVLKVKALSHSITIH